MIVLLALAAGLLPGGWLLFRTLVWHKEASQHALILALLWTYVMLALSYSGSSQLLADHRAACRGLKGLLIRSDPANADQYHRADEWLACEAYEPDYQPDLPSDG